MVFCVAMAKTVPQLIGVATKHTHTMKLYDINREKVFLISAAFTIQFSYLGTLFAEAWLCDDDAVKILEKFPNSVKLLVR